MYCSNVALVLLAVAREKPEQATPEAEADVD